MSTQVFVRWLNSDLTKVAFESLITFWVMLCHVLQQKKRPLQLQIHRLWSAQHVFHRFRSQLSLDKKKKRKQSTTKAANTRKQFFNIIQESQWGKKRKKKKEKEKNKADSKFQHATLFLGQVFFHRKPPILLVSVVKIPDISKMFASRLTKQRKGGAAKRGSHMTSSRHQTMHMTLQHPARQYRHTLQVMQLTHTRTQTHTLCKTKYNLIWH